MIKLKVYEVEPDLRHLQHEIDAEAHLIKDSMAYTNEDVKEHGWDKVMSWIEEDKQRIKAWENDEWAEIGFEAVFSMELPVGDTVVIRYSNNIIHESDDITECALLAKQVIEGLRAFISSIDYELLDNEITLDCPGDWFSLEDLGVN